jgi:glycosyltransferase involved in cell wall biosynthesis
MKLNSTLLERTASQRASISPIRLSLVIPVFNESEAIPIFVDQVSEILKNLEDTVAEFIFINDGSTDTTLDCLFDIQEKRQNIIIIDLTRNFGKEAAMTAGLEASQGDVVVPIDVDLQDPPELIVEMLVAWRRGHDVVLAKRMDRGSDTITKRISAGLFYRIHNFLSDQKIPSNVGDFRLIDQSVVKALRQLPESRRFMKGLFSWVGFQCVEIEYVRAARSAGKTKFNGWRLWNFALEGLTSFSTAPLRIWTYLGFLVATFSFLLGAITAVRVLLFGVDVPGYASVFVAVTFFGGLQLIGIGVLGEYVGRSYIESKRRPRFLVRATYE